MAATAQIRSGFGWSIGGTIARAFDSDCDFARTSTRDEYAVTAYANRYGGAAAPVGFMSLVRSKDFCTRTNIDGLVQSYGPPTAGDAPSPDATSQLSQMPAMPPAATQQQMLMQTPPGFLSTLPPWALPVGGLVAALLVGGLVLALRR